MRMIRPKLVAPQVTIAEDQDRYKPVTAALVNHDGYGQLHGRPNTVVLAFQVNEEERQLLVRGEPLYLSLLTFGAPMQPVILSVGAETVAVMYGVEVET